MPEGPKLKNLVRVVDRLQCLRPIGLFDDHHKVIHANRYGIIAREAKIIHARELMRFSIERRRAVGAGRNGARVADEADLVTSAKRPALGAPAKDFTSLGQIFRGREQHIRRALRAQAIQLYRAVNTAHAGQRRGARGNGWCYFRWWGPAAENGGKRGTSPGQMAAAAGSKVVANCARQRQCAFVTWLLAG